MQWLWLTPLRSGCNNTRREKKSAEAMATGNPGACALADFIFMKSDIISPYDLMASIGGETEVIVTFPTRLACHSTNVYTTCSLQESEKLTVCTCISSALPIGISIWDDNEHRLDISDFSPSIGRCLAHEVNVVKLGR